MDESLSSSGDARPENQQETALINTVHGWEPPDARDFFMSARILVRHLLNNQHEKAGVQLIQLRSIAAVVQPESGFVDQFLMEVLGLEIAERGVRFRDAWPTSVDDRLVLIGRNQLEAEKKVEAMYDIHDDLLHILTKLEDGGPE